MTLEINRRDGKAVYLQVAEDIKIKIRNGTWTNQIPSQRNLATEFGVNRTTIIKALEELKQEGLLEVRDRERGTFIVKEMWSIFSLKENGWGRYLNNKNYTFDDELKTFIRKSRQRAELLDFTHEGSEADIISAGYMDPIIKKTIEGYTKTTLKKSQRISNLKGVMVKKLCEMGIDTQEENILITNNSTQGLYLACTGLLPRLSQILTEECSPLFESKIPKMTQSFVKGIKLEREGLNIDNLMEKLDPKKTNLIYLNPSSHNPVGGIPSNEKRRELIGVSRGYKVPIIEEDSTRFLLENKELPKTIKEIGGEDVIYISDFSEIMPQELSLGYIIARRDIIKKLEEVKTNMGLEDSSFNQEIISNCIISENYKKVMIDRSKEKDRRCKLVQEFLKSSFNNRINWEINKESASVWIDLRLLGDELDILYSMVYEGILLYPGSFYGKKGRGFFKLCFLKYDDESLKKGIETLRRVVFKFKRH